MHVLLYSRSTSHALGRCSRLLRGGAALLTCLPLLAGCDTATTPAPAPLRESYATPDSHNIPPEDAAKVADFKLVDQDGNPFSADDMKGKVWGVSFFFTSCPGLCVKLNNAVNEVRQEFVDTDMRFLSVTVDPEVDTPEALTSYAAHFKADFDRWKFATGERAELKRVAREIFHQPHSKSTHNDVVSLVDREGRIRGYFHVTDPSDMKLFREKANDLLSESESSELGSSHSGNSETGHSES